jgi:hypothetical protein
MAVLAARDKKAADRQFDSSVTIDHRRLVNVGS